MDSLLAVTKTAKTASKAASSLPPPTRKAEDAPVSMQERKRLRDESESNYTCRGLDMEIRLAEAHSLKFVPHSRRATIEALLVQLQHAADF